MNVRHFVFTLICLSPCAVVAQDDENLALREITLSAAPVHGVELGMDAADAFEALLSEGLIQETNGTSYPDTHEQTLSVKAENNAIETIAFSTRETWVRDGLWVRIGWTGNNPRGESRYRSFDGDGAIWFIERTEILEKPSSFEAVFPALQRRFGFSQVNCEEPGSRSNLTRYGIHVNSSGTGEGAQLMRSMKCVQTISFRDVKSAAGYGHAFDEMVATSLNVELSRDSKGQITKVKFALTSPQFLMTEVDRFWKLTAEALNGQAATGSGLSDF